jgi:hypothetical protein
MATQEELAQLEELLDEVYQGQDRLTAREIGRAATEAELPADLKALVDGLPEGEYDRDEAAESLRQVARLRADADADPLDG